MAEDVPSIPGYVLGGLLGKGGMGSVYRARETATGRDVAIKWLPSSASETLRARFAREAHAVAALRHPHIVTLYTAGETARGRFLVMELVDGLTLETAFESRLLGHATLAELIARLARALAAAHQAGVIHRDVKPSNILIDAEGAPRLADFGLARVEDGAALTRANVAVGTLAYISPEVLEQGAARATAATDVFSLGCVLFEGLTGASPFAGDRPEEVIARVLETARPAFPPGVPDELVRLCERMLARDPAARPTAVEVAEILERGTPASPRRSPWLLAAVPLAAVALGGALALRSGSPPSPSIPPPVPATEIPVETPPPVAAVNSAPAPVVEAEPLYQVDLVGLSHTDFESWWVKMHSRTDFARIDRFARKTLESNPRIPEKRRHSLILTVRGRAALLDGRRDDAREVLDEALTVDPDDQRALVARIGVAHLDGDKNKAARLLARLTRTKAFSLPVASAIDAAARKAPDWEAQVKAVLETRSQDRLLLSGVLERLR